MRNIEALDSPTLKLVEDLVYSMLKELDHMPTYKKTYKNDNFLDTFLQKVNLQNYNYLLLSYEQNPFTTL